MSAAVARLYRYPIKGLSAEVLERVSLSPGRCLPHDRRFAIALGSTEFDPARPTWLSKTHFIMLMRDEALARLHTRFDPDGAVLSIEEDGKPLLKASLSDPDGCRRIARFFDEFMGGGVAGPLRVVEAPGHAFADARPKPNAGTDQYVSLINLASIRDLEGGNRHGRRPDPASAPTSISKARRPGPSRSGWSGTSRSGARGSGSCRRSPAAPRPRSTRTPHDATSTSSRR